MRVVDGLDRDGRGHLFLSLAGSRRKRCARRARGDGAAQSACSSSAPSIPTRSRRSRAPTASSIYNAAMIEAEGRRVLVQSTDEAEIALGIQRVLRERVITVCFLEGHGELPMDNFEFHTHLEGVADHSHGDASSHVVEMPGHGVGRFRRALEAQGYDAQKLVLATTAAVPADCTVVVARQPAHHVPAGRERRAARLSRARRSRAVPVRSRLRARARARAADGRSRRAARAAGRHRSAEPLPDATRDGGSRRLRSAPDHAHRCR